MKNKQSKILIIGAGLTGSTIANKIAVQLQNCASITIIDKRKHIAGNIYDHIISKVRVHKFGPHIFHTNNLQVVKYLSQFTKWTPYKHQVVSAIPYTDQGASKVPVDFLYLLQYPHIYVPFPINKNTIQLLGLDSDLCNLGEAEMQKIIIDTFYRPYSKKMWGMDIEELDPKIINRIPSKQINQSGSQFFSDYFPKDKFQALPTNGYTNMIKNMLDHENIKINLNTDYKNLTQKDVQSFDFIFSTMPIDEYFNFCFGELPWRSIKFVHDYKAHAPYMSCAQPKPVVNFTDSDPSKPTRQTEWIQFPNNPPTCAYPSSTNLSLVTAEYPCDYKDNNNERYYPIKDRQGSNMKLFKKYMEHGMTIMHPKTFFTGRCGRYAYINMDQAVSHALAQSNSFISSFH